MIFLRGTLINFDIFIMIYIIILDSCYTVLSPILRMFAFHVNDWWLQYAINLGQLLHFCFLLPCPDRWWCRKRIIFSNSWWFIRIFERSIVCFCFSFGFWWEKVFGSLGRLCIFLHQQQEHYYWVLCVFIFAWLILQTFSYPCK